MQDTTAGANRKGKRMKKPYGITQEQFDSMSEAQLYMLRIARKQDSTRRASSPIDKLMRRNSLKLT